MADDNLRTEREPVPSAASDAQERGPVAAAGSADAANMKVSAEVLAEAVTVSAEPGKKEASERQEYVRSGVNLQEERSYEPVDERELNRLRKLFLRPEAVETLVKGCEVQSSGGLTAWFWQRRILLLVGKQSTGKLAAARYIGAETRKSGNQTVLQYLDVRPPGLQDLISTVSSLSSAILIVNGIPPETFHESDGTDVAEILRHIARLLHHSNSLLFLTCHEADHTKLTVLSKVSDISIVPLGPADANFLQEVIRRHVQYYETQARDESESDQQFWEAISRCLTNSPELVHSLGETLKTPSQVNTFCEQLSRIRDRPDDSQIEDLLKEEAKRIRATDRRTVRNWFRSLSPQTRLYAMLQHLFRGLSEDDVHVIFRRFDECLFPNTQQRSEESWLGIEELDEKSCILRRGGDSICFTLPIYEQEVEQQIASYRHQLWHAIEQTVIPLALDYTAPQYWRLRMNLGNAIGRLGFYDWAQCRKLLDELAVHPNTPMRALCGHVISELLDRILQGQKTEDAGPRAEAIIEEISELLTEWVRNTGHDQRSRWTATAVLWRVFSTTTEPDAQAACGRRVLKLQDRAMEVLQEAAEIPVLTNRKSESGPDGWQATFFELGGTLNPPEWYPDFGVVTETFMRLFLLQPARTLEMLNAWLLAGPHGSAQLPRPFDDTVSPAGGKRKRRRSTQGGEPDEASMRLRGTGRTITALKAVCELLQLELSFGPQSLTVRRKLLRLADHCLGLAVPASQVTGSGWNDVYRQPVRALAAALVTWVREDEEQPEDKRMESLAESILEALIPAIDRSRDLQRNEFVTRIYQDWMNSESRSVRGIGRMLLARATFAEGRCMDQPGQQKVLLVLDTSNENRRMRLINDIAVSAAEQLRLESDVVWGRLGSADIRNCTDEDLLIMRQPLTRNYPRLIMPLLESIGIEQLHYALVLTTEVPADLVDADLPYKDRSLFRYCGSLLRPGDISAAGDPIRELLDVLTMTIFRDQINAQNLQQVLNSTREKMEESLVQRSPALWQRSLLSVLPQAEGRDSSTVLKLVSERIRQLLPAVVDIDQGVSSMRQLHTCLQWLFLQSSVTAVQVLEQSEEPAVGSCARMLLRLLLRQTELWQSQMKKAKEQAEAALRKYQRPAASSTAPAPSLPVAPSPISFGAALRLGLLIGRSDSLNGMQDYLRCLNLLWLSEQWQMPMLRSGEFFDGLDALSDFTRSELQQWLQAEGEKDSGLYGIALRHIRLGRRQALVKTPAEPHDIAIVYDAADEQCHCLAEACAKHISSQELHVRHRALVFPLGSCRPLHSPDGTLPQLDKSVARSLIPLIGPAADSLQKDRLTMLLLITRYTKPLDLQDVSDEFSWLGHHCCWDDVTSWTTGWESTRLNANAELSDAAADLTAMLALSISSP